MPYAIDRTDRTNAAVMVVLVHLVMSFVLVSGLRVGPADIFADALKSFEVLDQVPPEPDEEIPPPPLLEIPPPPEAPVLPFALLQTLPKLTLASAAEDAPAPPNVESEPAPVIAPTPIVPLPVQSPVRTAEVSAPSQGVDRAAGAAAVAGPGTGAGGTGTGFGGGGSGGLGGGGGGGLGREASYIPGSARARLARSVIRSAPYRVGRLPLRLSITPAGRVGSCVPLASSGSPLLDSELCRSVAANSRWIPAADSAGRPVTVELVFQATWSER